MRWAVACWERQASGSSKHQVAAPAAQVRLASVQQHSVACWAAKLEYLHLWKSRTAAVQAENPAVVRATWLLGAVTTAGTAAALFAARAYGTHSGMQ